MPYTFNTILLSAQKTGNPNLIGTSLSGTAVSYLSGNNVKFAEQKIVVVSLSTNDIGVAFNPIDVTIANTSLSTFNLTSWPASNITVQGSVFTIPNRFNTATLAVVKMPISNVQGYTAFVHNSAYTTTPLSAMTSTTDVSTPDTRRKYLLGYI